MAFGALGRRESLTVVSRRLDDLVGAQAPRADPNAPHAAVDHRPHHLKVGLEPARAHVMRVADLTADDRRLPANLTNCFAIDPLNSLPDRQRPRSIADRRELSTDFTETAGHSGSANGPQALFPAARGCGRPDTNAAGTTARIVQGVRRACDRCPTEIQRFRGAPVVRYRQLVCAGVTLVPSHERHSSRNV